MSIVEYETAKLKLIAVIEDLAFCENFLLKEACCLALFDLNAQTKKKKKSNNGATVNS